MVKILVDNDFVLDDFNPAAISRGIAERLRMRRLELNLTRQGLAGKSGVSAGTLIRFENKYEISLKHLLMIAVVLNSTEDFNMLFSKRQYANMEEVLNAAASKQRKRGRRNV
jgi:transcriptional regulator with XRE-family HTH domain